MFQVHGADGAGNAVLLKKLRRAQVLDFFSKLPPCVVAMALAHFVAEIGKLNAEIACRAKENDVARRLMTVPPLGMQTCPSGQRGIGPLIATAIAVLAPPPETFRKARDFAASC